MKQVAVFSLIFLSITACAPGTGQTNNACIHTTGNAIETRFTPPAGYERKEADKNSFAAYLRKLSLKPAGTKVKYFDGSVKDADVYDAVVDQDIGHKDLQQCADAVMRLRGEYFYKQKAYDKISFTLTNGFQMDYTEWMKGKRLAVNGNTTNWKQSAAASNTYEDFRNYMDMVFSYAGSLSLSRMLHPKSISDVTIGDVFIKGGTPGHAVIVVDVAENANGKKVFLLAQSYMPAQETQILKNPNDAAISPWYAADIGDELITPQWTFRKDQLMGW